MAIVVAVVLFSSSTSGIVFNTTAGALIDESQSKKYIDSYLKSQLYVEDQGGKFKKNGEWF